MVVIETEKCHPTQPLLHMQSLPWPHLKTTATTPTYHHSQLESILASVSLPTTSVETWDHACQTKVILQHQPNCALLDFITLFLLKIVQGGSLKARMCIHAYLAFCNLWVVQGKGWKEYIWAINCGIVCLLLEHAFSGTRMLPMEEGSSGEGIMKCSLACKLSWGVWSGRSMVFWTGFLSGCLSRNRQTAWCSGERRAGCSW